MEQASRSEDQVQARARIERINSSVSRFAGMPRSTSGNCGKTASRKITSIRRSHDEKEASYFLPRSAAEHARRAKDQQHDQHAEDQGVDPFPLRVTAAE